MVRYSKMYGKLAIYYAKSYRHRALGFKHGLLTDLLQWILSFSYTSLGPNLCCCLATEISSSWKDVVGLNDSSSKLNCSSSEVNCSSSELSLDDVTINLGL